MPDWVKNLGDGIVDAIDDGLDLIKDASQAGIDLVTKAQDFVEENTPAVIHVPVNAVMTAATFPNHIHNKAATIVDDYLFENEKREIESEQRAFSYNGQENVVDEINQIEQTQDEATRYAEEQLLNMRQNQNSENTVSANKTLRDAGVSVSEAGATISTHNQGHEV